MSSELSQVIIKMNSEINQIMERNLLPHFETIRIIETLLKQLPEFKRLEQENADLKQRLSLCNVINNMAVLELSNQEIQNEMPVPAALVPVPAVPTLVKNEIKLEIVETTASMHPIVSEDELYKTVNLSNHVDNKLQTAEEEEASEAEASEADVEEEEASEAEADASEADTSEADTSEAEEEEEEEEAAEEAAEEEEEEEEEAAEEEAAEEEEEEEEEEAEVEQDGGVGENPPEENPPEEEVYIITIQGKGNFYTSNETNGDIYQIEGEDDVGDVVGKFVNKVATFN